MRAYLDGARKIAAWRNGGSMVGGPPRAVWHTTENDPDKTSAASIAEYLNRVGYQVHIVWNPVSGEIVQMLPANLAGRGLENAAGGVQTNREGQVCIQIEVVGRASEPFTNGPMKGLGEIMAYLDANAIPRQWPQGPPPHVNHRSTASTGVWKGHGGHYGHSQVPENHHTDPGALDVGKLFGGKGGASEKPSKGSQGGVKAPKWPGVYLEYPPLKKTAACRKWQKRMKDRGWILEVDGMYGPISKSKCEAFQREKGLQVDGIVGPVTWKATWEAPIT